MNYLKYLVGGLVIVAVSVGVSYYLFGQPSFGASQAPGTTYGTGKIAEENLVVASDTVFSALNSDAGDRIITGFDMRAFNGAATSSLYTILCATSTTAGGFGANTNYTLSAVVSSSAVAGNTSNQFGTTTGTTGLYVSTSSPGIMSTTTAAGATGNNPQGRVWASGTYMVCKLTDSVAGANALNTLDSNTQGFSAFSYRAQ